MGTSKLLAVVVLAGVWAETNRAFGQLAMVAPESRPAQSVLDDTVGPNRLDEFGEGTIGARSPEAYSNTLLPAPRPPQALSEIFPGEGQVPMSGINPTRSIYLPVYKPVYQKVYRRYGFSSVYRK